MKKYEVWLADLDPSFGTEAGKKRPVVIVQNDLLNKKHPSSIVCPITSKLKAASILRVRLSTGDGGVATNSDIMVDQIRAIDNSRIIKKLGVISPTNQQILDENLKIVLDLP
jgi:mRNA interferase MazF